MSDFLNNLGKKFMDVAEDLEKKTEDTLEIQKIKSEIRSLKRANERDMLDIGKMVYDKFHSGEVSDIDYIVLCEAIEKREGEIAEQEAAIKRIKGEL